MSNNALQVFNYEDNNKIRAVKHDDDSIWFVAKDVADVLGFRDAHNAIRYLDADEKDTLKQSTPGGIQRVSMISESGLYTLAIRSNKPNAKPFRRWVTHDVIPTIRKTGGYGAINQSLLDRVEKLERENKELKDKFEKLLPATTTGLLLLGSKHDYTVQEAMQILAQHGFKIGQNSGYARMRSKNWLCSRKGKQWNHPTQRAIEEGLFHIMTDWKNRISIMVTPKALAKLADELTQEQMPVIYLIERDEPKDLPAYLK